MIERRKYKRYRIGEGVFVFSSSHPGRVNDISLGGVSFSHVYCAEDIDKDDTISILDSANDFYLRDVSCKPVCSFIENSLFPLSFMHTNKRSVQFSLSSSQKDQLEKYLQQHAIGVV